MRVGWWSRSGLLAGVQSAHAEMVKRDKRLMVFDALYENDKMTVVFARGDRAAEVRDLVTKLGRDWETE